MKKILFLSLVLLASAGCSIASPAKLPVVTDDFDKLSGLYENKEITLEGYILSPDINSELVATGNDRINLRDKPDSPGVMNDSQDISLRIMSEAIRKSLIDKYTDSKEEWIKVRVSGVIKKLPLSGMPEPGTSLEASSLIFIK